VLLRVEGLLGLVEGVQDLLVVVAEPLDLAGLEGEHDQGAEMRKGKFVDVNHVKICN